MTKKGEIIIGIIHNGKLYLSVYNLGEQELTEKVDEDHGEQGDELG